MPEQVDGTTTAKDATALTRMPAGERREQLLDAATRAFARDGYHGTSTDSVSREAGVSQPYVFQVFGTKLELFLQVFRRATDRLVLAFEEVLDARPFDPDSSEDAARLGAAYGLLCDLDLLRIIMHGYAAGGVEAIAEQSRIGMGKIFGTVRRTGWDLDQCRDFVARGILMGVLLSMRTPENPGKLADLDTLAQCSFGNALT